MGWITDRVVMAAKKVAETAGDGLPLQRAIVLHADELHGLVAIGVSLGRLAEALAEAGVVGARTGKTVAPRLVGRMLAKALRNPAQAGIYPPPAVSRPSSPVTPPMQVQPVANPPGGSRLGRGLESLAGRKSR